MRIFAPLIATLALGAPASAAPLTAPDYEGPMSVSYVPIMCIMAPCPPGDYTVTVDGEPIALAGKITLEVTDATGKVTTTYVGQYLGNGNVEGALWFDAETHEAIIRVDRFDEKVE